MRFIKRLSLNRPDPMSGRFAVEADGRIVTTADRSLQLPSGTTNARPGWQLSDPIAPVNGEIRYNTTLNEAEIYNESGFGTGWEKVKTNRQANIVSQNLGVGNYVNTLFGPLAYDVDPAKPQNVLVFIGPAWQIAVDNYTLVSSSTAVVTATSIANLAAGTSTIYVSTVVNVLPGMSVTGSGSIANATTVTQVSTVTNSVRLSNPTIGVVTTSNSFTFSASGGTYIQFTSPATPNRVSALLGFDNYTPPNS